MEKQQKLDVEVEDDDIDVENEEPLTDAGADKDERLQGCEAPAENSDICKKSEKEPEKYSKTGERNGFIPTHHRLTENYLKRKYSDVDVNGETPKKIVNDTVRGRTEEKSASSFSGEQIFPMDASLKTLTAAHNAGLSINSIINSQSSSAIGSLFEERLKCSVSTSEHSSGHNLSSAQKPHTCSSNPSSDSKEEPKLQISRPSFLITDILSSDSNKKDREACQSVFTDPRLLSLPHRHFIDRPMTASSCGSDPGSGPTHRYTDDSDLDDDKSDNEGNFITIYMLIICSNKLT